MHKDKDHAYQILFRLMLMGFVEPNFHAEFSLAHVMMRLDGLLAKTIWLDP